MQSFFEWRNQIGSSSHAGIGNLLKPGYVLAIEPMVNAGGPDVYTLDDGWTVVTRDGALSCYFEHTVAVTETGPEVLTLRPAIGATGAAARGAQIA